MIVESKMPVAVVGWSRSLMAAATLTVATVMVLASSGTAKAVSVESVAAGGQQNCAILTGGTVKCWGANTVGNLGDGSYTDSPYPVLVSDISDATSIDSGFQTTCAVRGAGTVSCWGAGTNGELGNGGTTNSPVPVQVSGITDATAVSLGDTYYNGGYGCALHADGTITCWGSDAAGVLGNGGVISDTDVSTTPVPVTGIANATAVSAGEGSACALISGGSVKCWGRGTAGELGNGAAADSSSPVSVDGMTDASAVAVSQGVACAVQTSGTNSCWGSVSNYVNYSIDNVTVGLVPNCSSCSSTPITDDQASGLTTITAGLGGQFCGVHSSSLIVCWGEGDYGQLGDGHLYEVTDQHVQVSNITSPSMVSAGFTTCAVWQSGSRVSCWGYGGSGQLGNGTTGSSAGSAVPVDVVWDAPPPGGGTGGGGTGGSIPPAIPPAIPPSPPPPPPTATLTKGKLLLTAFKLKPSKAGKCPKSATLTITAGKTKQNVKVKVTPGGGPGVAVCQVSKKLALKGKLKKAKKLKLKFSGKGIKTTKGSVTA